jgi:acyl-CoA hydrolase
MIPGWKNRAFSPEEALSLIQSGMRVFVHGASATPTPLLKALCARTDLERVNAYHLHLAGEVPFSRPEFDGRIRSVSLFTGPNMRAAVAEGRADFMPIFLSDIPGLFITRKVPLDAALLQLSPPDDHGLCTLGPSVDASRAAADSARIIVAEINEQMPRVHGNSVVPFHRISAFIHTDRPLCEHPLAPETDISWS